MIHHQSNDRYMTADIRFRRRVEETRIETVILEKREAPPGNQVQFDAFVERIRIPASVMGGLYHRGVEH